LLTLLVIPAIYALAKGWSLRSEPLPASGPSLRSA
jgi:hypothetical protein